MQGEYQDPSELTGFQADRMETSLLRHDGPEGSLCAETPMALTLARGPVQLYMRLNLEAAKEVRDHLAGLIDESAEELGQHAQEGTP